MSLNSHTNVECSEDPTGMAHSYSWIGLLPLLLVTIGAGACTEQPLRPLDIRYKTTDLNAYPLNPLLGEQINNPVGPGALAQDISKLPCIPPDQGDVDDAHWADAWYTGENTCTHFHVTKTTGNLLFGHVNFMPVTVQGTIYWGGHSVDEGGEDDDYTFDIATQDNALGSVGRTLNGDGRTALVHSEFDSDEAIDPLLDNVDEDDPFWWKQFKNVVDSDDRHQGKAAGPLIDGDAVIAIGLYNLDCFHPCGVELHPLYILAIHVRSDPRADRWALLAFNNGDQGYTGGDKLGLYPVLGENEKFNGADDQYSILLPQPTGAAGSPPVFTHKDVRICPGDNDKAVDAGNYFGSSYLPQKGLRLDFRLPDPAGPQRDNPWVIMGDITLDWGLTIPPPPPAR